MRAPLSLLLLLWPATFSAQASPDATITLTGMVRSQSGGVSQWGLFLPVPIVVHGARVNWADFDPDAHGISGYQDRFVEVKAGLRTRIDTSGGGTAVATLIEPRIKEADPPGMVRQDVRLSYTQHAVVRLAVAPSRFAWRDSTGAPSSVRPLVLFELANQGDTPIHLGFTNFEVFCLRVRSEDRKLGIDTSWTIQQEGVRRTSIVMGGRFKEVFELPPNAAPVPGRYRLRMELCSATAYGADLAFERTG
jgi:hypothetical protein